MQKQVPVGEMIAEEEGVTYSYIINNIESDGVYTLTCTVEDMAGNTTTDMLLSDGEQYGTVKFSINREGSTFAVDTTTEKLIENYFVYTVDSDVVIEEINVDSIKSYVVKLNGKELKEGTDYTTVVSDNDGEWYKVTYIINKSLFYIENEYNITVESTDKTDTTAYSDVKNLEVSFVVDRTAPVITVSGVESGGRYQVREQTVTIIPMDDGGRVGSVRVIVYDSDGNPLKDSNGNDISIRFDMSGDSLTEYLAENNGQITFTIPEGLENQVQIICNDCAVNADGTSNEYEITYTRVTVSQSGWIMFYANRPLFYGVIIGAALLVVFIIFIIILKKKKKKKEDE